MKTEPGQEKHVYFRYACKQVRLHY